jgi:hypothetical protein
LPPAKRKGAPYLQKGIEVKESVKGEKNSDKNSKSQSRLFLFRKY